MIPLGQTLSLEGRTLFVTGASSGIGAATAKAAANAGARVALVARRAEPLEDLAAEIGDAALALPVDVGAPDQVAAAFARAWTEMGGIDIAVNAAGVASPALLDDVSDENWNEMVRINLSGTFFVCREAGRRMREAGAGAIVNLGSELSFIGLDMCAAYCAVKAGVIGLTKALAIELAPVVRVNAVCPGPVDTPMLAGELAAFPDPVGARAATIERVPLKRLAQPEEIAEAVLFAATVPFATGATFVVDGGVTSM